MNGHCSLKIPVSKRPLYTFCLDREGVGVIPNTFHSRVFRIKIITEPWNEISYAVKFAQPYIIPKFRQTYYTIMVQKILVWNLWYEYPTTHCLDIPGARFLSIALLQGRQRATAEED